MFGESKMFEELHDEKNSIGFAKRECIAFSGYRAYKFGRIYPAGDAENQVKEMLRPVIIREYEKGARIFYTGMASGFDIWAAGEVISLRKEGVCPEASTIAVHPHSGQINSMRTADEKREFEKIIHESVNIILSDKYYKNCYLRRNDYMIANVSKIICYYDGQPGGTRYTINQARQKGLEVINLIAPSIF